MEAKKKIIREVLKSNEFHLYFNSLDSRVQMKYDYTILLLETQKVISTKFVKKIQEADFYDCLGHSQFR